MEIKKRLTSLPANLVVLVGVVAFAAASITGNSGVGAGFAVSVAITAGCVGWLAWDGWARRRRDRAEHQSGGAQ